jgi:hypothetical protein
MITQKIINFLRWLHTTRGLLGPGLLTPSEKYEKYMESIRSDIGLYREVRKTWLSFWHLSSIIFVLAVFLYYGTYSPQQSPILLFSFKFLLFVLIFICVYFNFYLPFEPYLLLKYSKKTGKYLVKSLTRSTVLIFTIEIVSDIAMLITFVLSTGISSKDVVWAGELFITFYLITGVVGWVWLLYRDILSNYKGKPTWFDELKARIEMREEKAGVKTP